VSDLFTDGKNNGGQWPQAQLHTQWPGTGRRGDAAFDQFYAAQVPFVADRFVSEELNAGSYGKLVERVGECYVVAHSQAGAYGELPYFDSNQIRGPKKEVNGMR
jgi:hypothetical protein